MRKSVIGCTLAACLFLIAADEGTKVTIKKLIERREANMATEKDDPFAGWEKGVELTLHVDGPTVAGATKYGKIKVTAATDDAGTNLAAKTGKRMEQSDEAGFEEVREPMQFGMDDSKKKPTGFDVTVKLPTLPKRSATMIKTLAGELQVLVGGEKKTITTPIKANYGKKIEHPALKAAGITFTLLDPKAKSKIPFQERGVNASITGDAAQLDSVAIRSAGGEKLSSSAGWTDEDGVRYISYGLDSGELPDDAVIQIEMYEGQKTLTVPFKFENVKLP